MVDTIYSLGINRHNASSYIFSLTGFLSVFQISVVSIPKQPKQTSFLRHLSVTDLWPRPFPACQVCSWVQVVPCYLSHLALPSPLVRLQVVRGKYHTTASRQGKYHTTASRQGKCHTTASRQGEMSHYCKLSGGNITLLRVVRGEISHYCKLSGGISHYCKLSGGISHYCKSLGEISHYC